MSFSRRANPEIPLVWLARFIGRDAAQRYHREKRRWLASDNFAAVRLVRPRLFRASFFVLLLWQTIAATAWANSPWVTLQGGHYLTKRPNDGDSFHISVDGKEYIFRLYFIDAPETSKEFRDRVDEQAKFYGITADQVLEVGDLAKRFVRERLNEPFLVRTCWEDAGGRSRMQRFYAFVQTKTGDLGEQLVENGLARSHSTTTRPDGLTAAAVESQKLSQLERKAMKEKVGGWGVNEGKIAQRASDPESEKGVDPFDRFFHPIETGQAAPPAPSASPVTEGIVAARTPSWLLAAQGPRPPSPPPTVTETKKSIAAITQTTPAPAAAPPPDSANAVPEGARSRAADFVPAPAEGPLVEVKLNINTASEAELENISGIGPVLANRIMSGRPFKTADDLRYIKGIGHITYRKIRPFFE